MEQIMKEGERTQTINKHTNIHKHACIHANIYIKDKAEWQPYIDYGETAVSQIYDNKEICNDLFMPCLVHHCVKTSIIGTQLWTYYKEWWWTIATDLATRAWWNSLLIQTILLAWCSNRELIEYFDQIDIPWLVTIHTDRQTDRGMHAYVLRK